MTTLSPPLTAHAAAWRRTLCDELLSIPALAERDPRMKRTLRDLSISIAVLDHGLHRLDDTGLTMADLRLGTLMRDTGYDPTNNLPYRGSLIQEG